MFTVFPSIVTFAFAVMESMIVMLAKSILARMFSAIPFNLKNIARDLNFTENHTRHDCYKTQVICLSLLVKAIYVTLPVNNISSISISSIKLEAIKARKTITALLMLITSESFKITNILSKSINIIQYHQYYIISC